MCLGIANHAVLILFCHLLQKLIQWMVNTESQTRRARLCQSPQMQHNAKWRLSSGHACVPSVLRRVELSRESHQFHGWPQLLDSLTDSTKDDSSGEFTDTIRLRYMKESMGFVFVIHGLEASSKCALV